MPYFLSFRTKLEGTTSIFEVSAFEFVKMQNSLSNKTFQVGDQKWPYGYFCARIWKNYCIFKISTFEFVKMQKFRIKFKKINLGPKLSYLGTFGLKIEKNYCRIWNQGAGIGQNANFYVKEKKNETRENCLSCVLSNWNLWKLLSDLKKLELKLPYFGSFYKIQNFKQNK